MTEPEKEVPKQKYTPAGLPVVRAGTIDSMSHYMGMYMGTRGAELEEEVKEIIKRIQQENPEIVRMIEETAKRGTFSPDFMNGYTAGILCAYEALRRQAESLQLEEQFGGP